MALGPVPVVGLDPARIPGWDPAPVVAATARGQARFGDLGIEADTCLVAPDDNPGAAIVRQHAPGAAIAFNSTPEDTADAALRWLR